MSADATDLGSVAALFDAMEKKLGPLDIVIYNAAARVSGAIPDLDPLDVQRVLAASTCAAFLVVQQAARRMLPRRKAAILLTGASASVKRLSTFIGLCDGYVRTARLGTKRRA